MIAAFLDQSLALFLEVLPFFSCGVLLAGLMQSFGDAFRFPSSWGRSVFAIPLGALAGCVVPVCSCGVVPLSLGLLAGGAPVGPVFAFLAVAPIVNPATFVMTAGVMGYELAVGRFFGAVLLGTGIGYLMRALATTADLTQRVASARVPCGCEGAQARGFVDRFFRSWYLAGRVFVSLLRYVTAGVIAGGVIAAVLSPEVVTRSLTGATAVPLAAAAGVPLYLCSCAEVPVALSLVRRGLAPGAVLTFLLAGPGVSIFTLTLLSGFLRLRLLLAYAVAFLAGSMLVGFFWTAVLP
jgi:hypothetical protein